MSLASQIEPKLRSFNSFLEKMMPLLTPVGVILGLILAGYVKGMKPAVTYLFAFLTLVSGMGVSVKDFFTVLKKPKPIFAFALGTYVVIPLLVFFVTNLLIPARAETITGFVLLYSIPTAVVGTVWSSIYRGNLALSLTILVIATVLSPIITPTTVSLLTSTSIQIDSLGLAKSLTFMVLIPSVLGITINYFTKGKCNDHVAPMLKPFTKIALLFVIIINTSQVAEDLIKSASLVYIPEAILAIVFTFTGFFVGSIISKLFKLNRDDTVSVTFAIGLRNISASLVLAIQFFPPSAVVPIIFGIVVQQTACAIAAKIIFKPELNKEEDLEKNEEN